MVCGPQPVLPTDKFADSALEALEGLKIGWSWQNVLGQAIPVTNDGMREGT